MAGISNPNGEAAARAAKALRLYEEEGLSYKALAERLGASLSSIGPMLATARKFRGEPAPPKPGRPRRQRSRPPSNPKSRAAFAMSSAGATAKTIAKALSVAESTVEHWLADERAAREAR